MATYVGLAIADSMFPQGSLQSRRPLTVDELKQIAPTAISCCNPSHANTLDVLKSKHGIDISAPEKAPRVVLQPGDSIVVISVRGLERATRERTDEEIQSATFEFALWEIHPQESVPVAKEDLRIILEDRDSAGMPPLDHGVYERLKALAN